MPAGAVGFGKVREADFEQLLHVGARMQPFYVARVGGVGGQDDGGARGSLANAEVRAKSEVVDQRAGEFAGRVPGGQQGKHAHGKVLCAAEGSPDERDAEFIEQAGFAEGADGSLVRDVEADLCVQLPGQSEGERVPVAVGRVVVVEIQGALLHAAELCVGRGRVDVDVRGQEAFGVGLLEFRKIVLTDDTVHRGDARCLQEASPADSRFRGAVRGAFVGDEKDVHAVRGSDPSLLGTVVHCLSGGNDRFVAVVCILSLRESWQQQVLRFAQDDNAGCGAGSASGMRGGFRAAIGGAEAPFADRG